MKFILQFTKHTQTPKFLWVILNQVILSLGALAIVVVLSNVLEAHTFGKTRFLAAVLGIFAFFSLPGIGPVVLQQMPIYSKHGFKLALIVQLKWGVGAAIGAALFALIFSLQGDADLARAFIISGILAPLANLYLMPGTALAGLQQFKKKALYDGLIISSVVLAAWYGAVTTGTVSGTMLWYFGVQSLVTISALYFVSKHLTRTDEPSFNIEFDAKYGKQLTLFQLPFALLPALEKVLIFVLLGPVALAAFIIAFLPIEHIKNAYRNALQFYVLPQLQSSLTEIGSLKHWIFLALLLSLGSIVAIIVFAFFLLPVVFSGFEDVRSFMLLSAIIPLTLPSYIFILKFLSERSIGRLYSYSIITVIIDILAFTILTSMFGLPGAVTAKIATAFIAALIAITLYRSGENGTKMSLY